MPGSGLCCAMHVHITHRGALARHEVRLRKATQRNVQRKACSDSARKCRGYPAGQGRATCYCCLYVTFCGARATGWCAVVARSYPINQLG